MTYFYTFIVVILTGPQGHMVQGQGQAEQGQGQDLGCFITHRYWYLYWLVVSLEASTIGYWVVFLISFKP